MAMWPWRGCARSRQATDTAVASAAFLPTARGAFPGLRCWRMGTRQLRCLNAVCCRWMAECRREHRHGDGAAAAGSASGGLHGRFPPDAASGEESAPVGPLALVVPALTRTRGWLGPAGAEHFAVERHARGGGCAGGGGEGGVVRAATPCHRRPVGFLRRSARQPPRINCCPRSSRV